MTFGDSPVFEVERKRKKPSQEQSRSFTRCGETRTIPIKNILPNPNQPRQDFDKRALQDLAISIMEYGLMQPISVKQIGPFDYELIAGERRLTACKSLGMAYIPAIVMTATATDSAILALVENIQRENLNYLEEAEAFRNLIQEHGLTQEELADKLGKSQSTVANKLRILKLPIKVRQILIAHSLTERHARALLRLKEEKQQLRAAKVVAERGLNVAKTEELIDRLLKAPKKPEVPAPGEGAVFRDIRIFHNTIRQAVDLFRRSGRDITANKSETETAVTYHITIQK